MREGAHSKPMGTNKLTIKQENFCNYYLESGNASEAYRRAYKCGNIKDEVIWVKASELLKNGKVSVRVEELRAELKGKSDFKKEEGVKWLSDLINFEPAEYLYVKSVNDIPKKYRRLVQSLKPVENGYLIEFCDKQKAIDQISKMLGWNEAEKHDIEIKKPMTNEEAREIIDKLGLR
jgi:phage terminase small subunit